ncbi:hypothetical protein GCM10009760_54880 [Kitasatospora kazusensis]|uniref:Uncharacterized protein n=1 Tax=Kitasatospora kazusensis TaxID=407974 RepID=A0ABN3A6V5_9ACTN
MTQPHSPQRRQSADGTPPAHYVRPAEQPTAAPVPASYTRWEWFTRFLSGLVADRTHGDSNALVPRGADGRRTAPFSFNGSGKGR